MPLLGEMGLEAAEADELDEHGENLAHPRRRGRLDTLRTKGVQRKTEFLAGGPVGPSEDLQAEADLGAYLVDGEVEDSVEGDLIAVEHPWKESFDPNNLALTQALQFCNHARAALAEVEDGEAARRVESAAVDACAFPAERLVVGGEVPPTLAGQRRERRGGYPAGVDCHAAMPSRPQPWPVRLR
jgi:hypothetical protein